MEQLQSLGLRIYARRELEDIFWGTKPDDRSLGSVIRERIFKAIPWLERLKLPYHLHTLPVGGGQAGWYARSAKVAWEGDYVV